MFATIVHTAVAYWNSHMNSVDVLSQLLSSLGNAHTNRPMLEQMHTLYFGFMVYCVYKVYNGLKTAGKLAGCDAQSTVSFTGVQDFQRRMNTGAFCSRRSSSPSTGAVLVCCSSMPQ